MRTWYLTLARPPLTPPNWAFPLAWTTLYVLMGIAAWRVWHRVGAGGSLRLWGWQLLLNGLWTPAFFGLHSPPLAFAVILALLVVLALTVRAFARLDRIAAALMLPYLAWVLYAAYLNLGFWALNPA